MLRPPKVENWRGLLNEYIEQHRETIFDHNIEKGLDCCRWVGGAKFVVTGVQYKALKGAKYKTAAGAFSYLQRLGAGTVEELADKILGDRQPISFAAAGDVVLANLEKLNLSGGEEQTTGLTLGICNGAVSYFMTDNGPISVPTLTLEACYYG